MKYLILLLLLTGCGEYDSGYNAEKKRIHDWTKQAWIHSAMCERCSWYKANGYKDEQQKEMCKKYAEESSVAGYEVWFEEKWKTAVDEHLTKR